VQYISISKSNILFFTGPLYVPFLAYFILNERISKIDIVALTLGFIGMILINNPFSDREKGENELLGTILSLAGGVTSSIAWISIRKMSSKCHFTIAPFYFSLGCTFCSSLLFIWSSQGKVNKAEYGVIVIITICAIGLITFIGQLLQSLAYEYEKASRVAVFYYLQTFLVFLFDYIFFGTTYGMIEIFGAFLIVG
jgi:drug/metabolite transporter (DMT)-like permease